MNTARPNSLDNLLSLKQASEKLAVSIEILLSWNQNNILKPTITQNGQIGYTQEQIDQFLTIRQLVQKEATSQILGQQLETPPVQTAFHSPSPMEDAAYAYHRSDTNTVSKPSSVKSFSPQRFLSFAALFVVVLSFALFSQQGILQILPGHNEQKSQKLADNKEKVLAAQISKFRLSEQITSALPTKLRNEVTFKENIQNVGESVFKDKIIAPALYEIKTKNNIAINNQQRQTPVVTPRREPHFAGSEANHKPGSDIITAIPDTYAQSTTAFQDTCTSCTTDENAAIDEHGNIRGETKTDTLATIVGGLGDMIDGNSFKDINTDETNQLWLLVTGMLVIFFVFQKQFAYATKKPQQAQIDAYKNHDNPASQKILEVDQKTDGTVMLYFQGKEYRISKPELSSESDQFIETLMELVQPDIKELEYNYDVLTSEKIRLTTPLSRLVTRLGFVGTKRDLFFPRTSKNGVLFRRYITQQDLTDMNLTTDQILSDLTITS